MIQTLLKEYKCVPGERFAYSSQNKSITFIAESMRTPAGKLALLHEIAHMKLGHFSYKYDLELFKMEIDAWEEAKVMAKEYLVKVDESHIDDCLLSYDKWVTKRATCPRCKSFGLQKTETLFSCVSCDSQWKVNKSRNKRILRKLIN
ncbi:MAG: hypothetical protein M1355_00475 [Patescibacteria group bacterium]|nr:hypothetical protein [Patescibacteria group bacterium]